MEKNGNFRKGWRGLSLTPLTPPMVLRQGARGGGLGATQCALCSGVPLWGCPRKTSLCTHCSHGVGGWVAVAPPWWCCCDIHLGCTAQPLFPRPYGVFSQRPALPGGSSVRGGCGCVWGSGVWGGPGPFPGIFYPPHQCCPGSCPICFTHWAGAGGLLFPPHHLTFPFITPAHHSTTPPFSFLSKVYYFSSSARPL